MLNNERQQQILSCMDRQMLCALHICQNRNTVRRYLDIRIHGKFCG